MCNPDIFFRTPSQLTKGRECITMVQIKNRFDISSEALKKIACANVANSVDATAVRDLEFVGVTNRRYWVFKRMMDIILSLVALFIIAIPMLIVFLIVYIQDWVRCCCCLLLPTLYLQPKGMCTSGF